MAKGSSKDLRERAVAIVEDGESAREAARLLWTSPAKVGGFSDKLRASGEQNEQSEERNEQQEAGLARRRLSAGGRADFGNRGQNC